LRHGHYRSKSGDKNLPFLLSDTVGFIRKLQHNWLILLKVRLDEVREADLLHVVDISHPEFEDHIASNQTLLISNQCKPVIMVLQN
jgi:GTP-binding protein HflX